MGRELTVDVATAADGGKAPTGTPVEGCWFCLSNPNADVNLLASIGMSSISWTLDIIVLQVLEFCTCCLSGITLHDCRLLSYSWPGVMYILISLYCHIFADRFPMLLVLACEVL